MTYVHVKTHLMTSCHPTKFHNHKILNRHTQPHKHRSLATQYRRRLKPSFKQIPLQTININLYKNALLWGALDCERTPTTSVTWGGFGHFYALTALDWQRRMSLQKQGQLNVRWPHIGPPSNKIGEDEGEHGVKLKKQGTRMPLFVNRRTKGKKRVIDRGEWEKKRKTSTSDENKIPPVVQFLAWRMQIFTPYIKHAIIFNTWMSCQ